jgi:hypothetical protein
LCADCARYAFYFLDMMPYCECQPSSVALNTTRSFLFMTHCTMPMHIP